MAASSDTTRAARMQRRGWSPPAGVGRGGWSRPLVCVPTRGGVAFQAVGEWRHVLCACGGEKAEGDARDVPAPPLRPAMQSAGADDEEVDFEDEGESEDQDEGGVPRKRQRTFVDEEVPRILDGACLAPRSLHGACLAPRSLHGGCLAPRSLDGACLAPRSRTTCARTCLSLRPRSVHRFSQELNSGDDDDDDDANAAGFNRDPVRSCRYPGAPALNPSVLRKRRPACPIPVRHADVGALQIARRRNAPTQRADATR